MCEENTSQKERFLQEVEQKLLRRDLDARLLGDGLIHVRWNKQPLCSVDRDGIVRFRPVDITGPAVDRQLRTVTQTAAQVKEYMQIFDRAPALKAVGLDDTYKVLADFGDISMLLKLIAKKIISCMITKSGRGLNVKNMIMEIIAGKKQIYH